jgi:DNA-binding CsgD family transcriptional regulator
METILEVERLVPGNGLLSAANGTGSTSASPLDLVHAATGYWRALHDLLGRIPPIRNADPRWFSAHSDVVCLGGRVDGHAALVGGGLADPAFTAMAGVGTALVRDDALQALAEEQVQLAACLPEVQRHRQPIHGRISEAGGAAEWVVMPFSASGETIDAVLAIYARTSALAGAFALRLPGQLDQVLLDAVERSKTGVAVLNAENDILYMNAAARPVLAAGGSIGLADDARLEIRSGRAAAMIAAARSNSPQIYRALLDDMIFFVQPCELGVLLAFRMLDANLDLFSIARETFKLTPAEARIAVGIASGRTVQETAQLVGVTADTARSQLKAALARMGISRQQELVRRFCLAATV